MDFMLSGLVVHGQDLDFHRAVQAMEADSTSRPLDTKTKEDVKREKNRESSARSRQRKKDEDERNMMDIARLEADNRRLQTIVDGLLADGRAVLDQVHPFYLTQPACRGCYQKEASETGQGTSDVAPEGSPDEDAVQVPVAGVETDQLQDLESVVEVTIDTDQEPGLAGLASGPGTMDLVVVPDSVQTPMDL